MGGPATAVADREHLGGGEQAEQDKRDRDPNGRTDQHVGRGLSPQGNAS
jgi:hypothetical protein